MSQACFLWAILVWPDSFSFLFTIPTGGTELADKVNVLSLSADFDSIALADILVCQFWR